MVGTLVSFWDGLFSGAMLVLGSVVYRRLPTFDMTFPRKSLRLGETIITKIFENAEKRMGPEFHIIGVSLIIGKMVIPLGFSTFVRWHLE